MVFKVVPMLNPDGVIMGNARTGVFGKDLNREFESTSKVLNPEVAAVKELVRNCKIIYGGKVTAFLDLHGHSAKRSIFAFGPEWPITDLNYQRARIIPRLIDRLSIMFRFYSCSFRIPASKQTTARAVMQHRLGIPIVYTLESSIDSYFDR